MRKVFLALSLALVFVPALAASAFAALSVDDFIPPVQVSDEAEKAELLKVQAPDEVKEAEGVTGKPAISGANAQEAVNAWVAKRTGGFAEILFPSGFGFVATGIGIYERHDNPVAARITQRDAYVRAYMDAKRQLAEGLYGLHTSGSTEVLERIATINESLGQTLVNMESVTNEGIQQRLSGLLRGFVVYEVFDDANASRVYLTIVTTPKTQGHYDRPDASSIAAASVNEGLAQVFAEIENGLTPPVGGMTVFVPATGELAFVGFGSAVIGRQDNAAVQARLELNAERIARARASDSLCGIIYGERISASETVESELVSMTRDFEELTKDDPAVRNDPEHPGYVKLQERKSEFKAAEANQIMLNSARDGILPPGVQHNSWKDKDNAFSYAVAVYLHSASGRAAEGAASMMEGTIVQPLETPKEPEKSQAEPQEAPGDEPAVTPREEVKQGPSGTVQDIEKM